MYKWTPIASTQLEIGYDNVKSQRTSENNNQYKITLAQQWQAGNSVWSRPAIRIFATYAKWDENWGYSNTSGLQTKDSSGSGAFTSSRGDDSEVTFGARWKCGGNTVRRTVTRGASAPPDYSGLARYCRLPLNRCYPR